MEIELAMPFGFCFGVRRAIEMVEEAAGQNGGISSLGSIVHNPQVVRRLGEQGVSMVHGFDEAATGTVAITAHGVGPGTYEEAGRRNLALVDTTCPIVARAQRAARRLTQAGFSVVIYGDDMHPEVRGVLAWTKGKGVVIVDPHTPVDIPGRKVALLSQTTKSEQSFAHFVGEFLAVNMGRINEVRIVNTTCPETGDRYEAARRLAAKADLMIVVGGKNSANTRKLADTCAAAGAETHHVESTEEIDPAWLKGRELVGLTAGASTPDESVDEVLARLRELDGKHPKEAQQ
jgi:4-hydroxy-3-methylbut-2-enyl diphosphate reductase